MPRTSLFWMPLMVAFATCRPTGVAQTPTPPEDTGEEPKVLQIDTSVFLPQDTAQVGPPDLVPDNYVLMSQIGLWNLSNTQPPFTSLSGTLNIAEYIDVLDTALPVYECNVAYALTGTPVETHTCADCDFVFDVEYYVNAGDPSTCHDPDAPPHGVIWQLGFDEQSDKILLNYYGTDVWLPWYDASKNQAVVSFNWAATLAIELVDTGDMQ